MVVFGCMAVDCSPCVRCGVGAGGIGPGVAHLRCGVLPVSAEEAGLQGLGGAGAAVGEQQKGDGQSGILRARYSYR